MFAGFSDEQQAEYQKEAEARWGPLREDYGDVELHLVGPLQSNKVRRAVEADGFNMSIDIPDFVESEARIDDDNSLIYPGSDFAGMHVQGGRERRGQHGREDATHAEGDPAW